MGTWNVVWEGIVEKYLILLGSVFVSVSRIRRVSFLGRHSCTESLFRKNGIIKVVQ